MPRKKKPNPMTQSGAPAQQVKSVPGQRYGEGVAMQQLQESMPTPNNMAVEQRAVRVPATQPQTPAPQPQPVATSQQVSPQEYLAGLNAGLLQQPPSAEKPLTFGLAGGPGAGPSAVQPYMQSSNTARHLERMYRRTNDPIFRKLLDRQR